MDAKITKRRLSEMLQYDWVKIIGMIVVAVVVWELIFTVSAVRVKTGQNFKVYYYPTTTGASGLLRRPPATAEQRKGVLNASVFRAIE